MLPVNYLCYPFELLDAVDWAPVKFHAAADAICSWAKNHCVSTDKVNIVRTTAIVCQVEVVSARRPLGGDSVDLLHTWTNVQLMTSLTDVHFCTDVHTTYTLSQKMIISHLQGVTSYNDPRENFATSTMTLRVIVISELCAVHYSLVMSSTNFNIYGTHRYIWT